MEGRIAIDGEVGNGLAQVAIVVDYFADGKAERQQILAVLGRGDTDLGQGRHAVGRTGHPDAVGRRLRVREFGRPDQLVEEQGHAVLQLFVGSGAPRAYADLFAAAFRQFCFVCDQKSIHHGEPQWFAGARRRVGAGAQSGPTQWHIVAAGIAAVRSVPNIYCDLENTWKRRAPSMKPGGQADVATGN
jgi:hypothetical protein